MLIHFANILEKYLKPKVKLVKFFSYLNASAMSFAPLSPIALLLKLDNNKNNKIN